MCKAVENYANELAEERAKVLAEERAKVLAEERAKVLAEERAKVLTEERAKVLEKGYIEKSVKAVKMMLDEGVKIETALRYANIDLQTYEKYSESVQ